MHYSQRALREMMIEEEERRAARAEKRAAKAAARAALEEAPVLPNDPRDAAAAACERAQWERVPPGEGARPPQPALAPVSPAPAGSVSPSPILGEGPGGEAAVAPTLPPLPAERSQILAGISRVSSYYLPVLDADGNVRP